MANNTLQEIKRELGERPCIILDLNGCFCFKENKGEDLSKYEGKKDVRPYYTICERKGSDNFLGDLLEIANVVILTSTTAQNAKSMMELAFSAKNIKQIKGVLYREFTQLDPEFGIDSEIKSTDTIKMIDTIFKHPFINKDRNYGPHNTIIADNDYRKIRFNPSDNIFVFDDRYETPMQDIFDSLMIAIANLKAKNLTISS